MKVQITKSDLKSLIENLHSQFKIHPVITQQVIDELLKKSAERELVKKKRYAQANYYLPIFNKIFRDITLRTYYPRFGLDNAALKDVISILRKNDYRVEDFFMWVCKNKDNEIIQKTGLIILNKFTNEYVEYRKKNEF